MGLEQFPVPVVATGAAIWYGQGSDRRSDPSHHRGNIEEVSYLAAAFGHENKIPLHHNQSMEGDQGYAGVVCAIAKGGSGVAAGLGKLVGAEAAGGGLAAATALLGGAANAAVGVTAGALEAICSWALAKSLVRI